MTDHHAHDLEMLDCESVMRQLWDYLDDELSADRIVAIRAHLAVCTRCHPQYEFERAFLTALERAQRTYSDPTRLRARVSAALRSEGMVGV